jgi:helicase
MSFQKNLFPSQVHLLEKGYLHSSCNWLICAPTGSGKTRMGEWALEQSVNKGYLAAYLAPLKAIVDERMDEWKKKYPELEIGLYTGETTRSGEHTSPKNESILLFTPEKLASYLQNWKKHLSWLAKLDTLVIDEIHLLGDPHRGATLEALIGRLQRINPFIRIIGLSGTLSNSEEIASWIKAQLFVTAWRPIPIEHRLRRFKKASDKQEILLEEVRTTLSEKGKVLIFVNSRRRSEQLVQWLREHNIKADYNHAGLARDQRMRSQQQMRQGKLDVMVSTSTLEMGVNFPARKVIIYDAYGFDGERFSPLSIQRYRQSAGRAGRAGFDEYGEAVLLLPIWHRDGERYLTADPEPVRSGLFSTQNLLKEILTEVAGRLSISEEHLEINFANRTLWRKQDGRQNLSLYIKHLVLAGLIKEKEKGNYIYLSPTALGRVVMQMSLSPQTAGLLADFFQDYKSPTEYDLLLICCLTPEVTPKLGFNFEEIDQMADVLLGVPSALLDSKPDWLLQPGRHINEKKLLSAIKCATVLYQHIQGENLEALAESYDCYPADLYLLKAHIGWILDAAPRIFSVLTLVSTPAEDKEAKPSPSNHEVIAQELKQMVEYGIPRHALGLITIKGIGAKRAQKLVVHNIFTPEQVLKTEAELLSEILKLRPRTIERILKDAAALKNKVISTPDILFKSVPKTCKKSLANWPADIDPYRLRRALELDIDHQSAEYLQISGGTEPHRVEITENAMRIRSYKCDCMDFQQGTVQCKHIIRARLEHSDKQVLELLKQMANFKPDELRFSLGELWMKSGRTYDAFLERNVDYQGNKFLAKTANHRRNR